MRVFVTGASGFIGTALIEELISAGHEVIGLVRSEESAVKVRRPGVKPLIGSIQDANALRRGARECDAAVQLAFFHKISHANLLTRLHILLGGSPAEIPARFTAAAVEAECNAIEEIGSALTGSNRAFVSALPTMTVASGKVATELDSPDPRAPGGGRARTERVTLGLASRGIRASVVRLPPAVHSSTRQGLATMLADIARKKKVSAYVGAGANRWGAVHVKDAARLLRLALENGLTDHRYHAVAEEGIPLRSLAEKIGEQLRIPTESISLVQAKKHFSWLTPFVAADNAVSSGLTQEALFWRPNHPTLFTDLDSVQQ